MAFKPLKMYIEKVTLPLAKRYGILLHQLISNWKVIAGPRISKICIPIKVVFPFEKNTDGILYLAVSNPGFGLELQAQEGWLLERIATYQGYKPLSRIKIHINTKSINSATEPIEVSPIPAVLNPSTIKILNEIKDNSLREILSDIARYKNSQS